MIGQAVLGKIEQNVSELPGKFGEARRIFGEQVAQVPVFQLVVVGLELSVGRQAGKGAVGKHGVWVSEVSANIELPP